MSEPSTGRDGPPILIPLAGLLLLVFLLGTMVVHFRLFPYREFLEPAYSALQAQLDRRAILGADPGQLPDQSHWRPARTSQRGLARHVPERSQAGYTLYTSAHASAAFLVDERGELAHRWHIPFHEVWPNPPHVERSVSEDQIWWANAIAFPNGDLVARYNARGDTPYGYGLVKLNRDSEVIWRFGEQVHHDVRVVEEDSTLVALVHRFRATDDSLLADLPLPPQILEDEVVRLSADGQVMDRLNLVDAFARSDHRWLLTTRYAELAGEAPWDLLHANTVQVVDEEWAAHHDFAEPGWILVSMRTPSLLALFDPESGEARWMRRGLWTFQHDPHPTDDGNLILFDNEGHGGAGGSSRVVEFDPATGALAWEYVGTADDPFYSQFSSHVQVLSNDNVLITESNAGRILEVARDGEVVWEFWNPERLEREGEEFLPSVYAATRYAPGELPFLER